MIDGQINNTPTAAELEEKAKAGEQISLAEYAKALKTDKERASLPNRKSPLSGRSLKQRKNRRRRNRQDRKHRIWKGADL